MQTNHWEKWPSTSGRGGHNRIWKPPLQTPCSRDQLSRLASDPRPTAECQAWPSARRRPWTQFHCFAGYRRGEYGAFFSRVGTGTVRRYPKLFRAPSPVSSWDQNQSLFGEHVVDLFPRNKDTICSFHKSGRVFPSVFVCSGPRPHSDGTSILKSASFTWKLTW